MDDLEFCSFLNAQPSRGMVAEYVQVYLSKKVSSTVMSSFTAEFLRQGAPPSPLSLPILPPLGMSRVETLHSL